MKINKLVRFTRLVMLIILVFGIVNSSFAQVGLSEEQKKKYEKNKLSVEVTGMAMGSYSAGMVSATSWRKWHAYKGFTPISEEEFFRKTGYEEEARQAASFRKKGNMLFWGGLTACTLGVILALISGEDEDGYTEYPLLGYGAIIGVAGLVPMVMSIGYRTTNWAPYSSVEGIADDYNKQLLVQIKKEF